MVMETFRGWLGLPKREVAKKKEKAEITQAVKETEKPQPLEFFGHAESIKSWYEYKKGEEHKNQDRSICDHDLKLYAVFDGVGGVEGGEEAAEKAKTVFEQAFASTSFDLIEREAEEKMRAAIQEAHNQIARIEVTDDEGNKKTPATTASVLKFFRNPETKKLYAIIGNVGDSRVYQKTQGKLRKITEDHDLDYRPKSSEQRDKSVIFDANSEGVPLDLMDVWDGKERVVGDIDMLEKAKFSRRVSSILGGQKGHPKPNYVDTSIVRHIQPGDSFFLMTDGPFKNLSYFEIDEVIENSSNPSVVAQNLADTAFVRSCKYGQEGENLRAVPDDITIVGMQVDRLSQEVQPQTEIRQAA